MNGFPDGITESPIRRIAEARILQNRRIAKRIRTIRCDSINPDPDLSLTSVRIVDGSLPEHAKHGSALNFYEAAGAPKY